MFVGVSGPNPATVTAGLVEAVEAAVCPKLGAVFGCVEQMQELFHERLGHEPQHGEVLHILAAGTLPSARGSGVALSLVAMSTARHLVHGTYQGVSIC